MWYPLEVGLDIAIIYHTGERQYLWILWRGTEGEIWISALWEYCIILLQDVGGYFFLATMRRQGHRARFGFIVGH